MAAASNCDIIEKSGNSLCVLLWMWTRQAVGQQHNNNTGLDYLSSSRTPPQPLMCFFCFWRALGQSAQAEQDTVLSHLVQCLSRVRRYKGRE